MGEKRAKTSEQLLRAMRASGLSRYAIHKATGIDQSILSRFATGKSGLSLENVDLLANVLGLDLVARKAGRKVAGREARARKAR